jgi:hypothetical protein
MAQNKLPDVAPRTVRVHIPTYNAILEFFRLSPSGLRGSDAIRQVLMQFGKYCEDQMKAGRTASTRDLLEAEKTFHRIMDNDPIGKTQGESTDD